MLKIIRITTAIALLGSLSACVSYDYPNDRFDDDDHYYKNQTHDDGRDEHYRDGYRDGYRDRDGNYHYYHDHDNDGVPDHMDRDHNWQPNHYNDNCLPANRRRGWC